MPFDYETGLCDTYFLVFFVYVSDPFKNRFTYFSLVLVWNKKGALSGSIADIRS